MHRKYEQNNNLVFLVDEVEGSGKQGKLLRRDTICAQQLRKKGKIMIFHSFLVYCFLF